MNTKGSEQLLGTSHNLLLGGHTIQLGFVTDPQRADVTLELSDPTDIDQVTSAAQAYLGRQYWFLDERYHRETLTEKIGIQLDNKRVAVYNFATALTELQREIILETLKRVYDLLPNDNVWSLDTIQICRDEPLNEKNSQFMRGREFPMQNRFELYPAAFKAEPYRNGELGCSELQGTLAHETTHVVLEETLQTQWGNSDLGWKTSEDFTIELPGGGLTNRYNSRPMDCPTTYGSLDEKDDRAESVVAFLFDPTKLNSDRTQLLTKGLASERGSRASVEILEPRLPAAPKKLRCFVPQKKALISWQDIPTIAKERITLNEFRERLGIALHQ